MFEYVFILLNVMAVIRVWDAATHKRDENFRLGRLMPVGRCLIRLAGFLIATSLAFGQISVPTQHYDNARTGQNVGETLLTHASVNATQFGKLFTQSLDGQQAAQPLYVPNLFIPATNSIHNVVYVATQHDSVYAFDADNNQGTNAAPLWQVNFLDPSSGVTTIPVADESCNITGFTEFGIESTPVIDLNGNAIYVMALTKENGNYVHKLHALDLSTGFELFGGPVKISASVTIDGKTYPFVDKYQIQRPGLLLQGGNVYIGFGSPGCNINTEMGWVMAYDAGTLMQVGVFDDSPGIDASAIWMSGAGLAGDGNGNIFFSTGDGLFDVNTGGNHFGDSVLKLSASLALADYFTPSDQLYLQTHDLDLGSGQVIVLPDQGNGQLAITVGKNGVLYLLDPNNMGQFDATGDQIVQEVVAPVAGDVHAGLSYWNNTVFLQAENTPVMSYSYSNGQLSTNPTSETSFAFIPNGGIVSANGNADAIFWCVSQFSKKLYAFDATNLSVLLYNNAMAGTRDALGPMVHFGMPVVANGKLYINGTTQLSVFGLLPFFAATSGNNQSGTVGTTLAVPLQVTLTDAYTRQADAIFGVAVSFSDGTKGGTFSSPSLVTDDSGQASTTYTLPTKAGTYTITASNPNYVAATFVVTANSGPPATFSILGGNGQTGPVAAVLTSPLKVLLKDAHGNGVPGVTVSFDDGGAGGSFSSPSGATDSSGNASTLYTTPTKSGKVHITASVSGLTSLIFNENVNPGPPASQGVYAGNNQTVVAGKTAAQFLQVSVRDQYGNAIPGVSVTYNDAGAGGSFSVNPAPTNSNGIAGTKYTVPTKIGSYLVTASSAALTSVSFNITVKAAAAVSLGILSGNNQTTIAGTTLPNPLVVAVTDQYGNPVPGKTVSFSDGGAGGKFSPVSGVSDSSGQVETIYKTPNAPRSITITAASSGLASVTFSETAQ